MQNIIRVNLDDEEIGYIEKAKAHETPVLHRAFSVFLYNGNEMLVQTRHRSKYHSGGLIANACCSHPRQGETLAEAIPRRLKEELGICCEAEEIFSFTYLSKYAEDLYEYEYDHVFLGTYEGEVCFDPEEIERTEWVSIDALKKDMVENPTKYATWFLIAAPRVFREIEKKQMKG